MFSIDQLRIFTEPQQARPTTTCWPSPSGPSSSASARSSAATTTWRWAARWRPAGCPGPTDAWTTFAGLARETSTIRLGTLVTSATFRLPGPLAITVAGVDQMSGGRVDLGLGAGWYEQEHQAYAIPFPPLGERFDRLEEQLAVITGLWSTPVGEPFEFDGTHYRVTASPALPKPVQAGGIPIVIGGGGPKRTPALAARYAAEYNTPFVSTDRFAEQRAASPRVRGDRPRPGVARVQRGRGRVPRRRRRRGRRGGRAIGREADELRTNGVAGTPDEVRATLQRWSDAGAERIYLQVLDLADLDHLDAIAALVA